jgi:uroporphyrinogen-III synthase
MSKTLWNWLETLGTIFSFKEQNAWNKAGGNCTARQPKKLAVTRPVGKGGETAEFIHGLGWDPVIVHTVELRPRDQSLVFSELREVFSTGNVDWLVFMSPEGVQPFFEILKTHGNLLPTIIGQSRIVAVGPRTRDFLERQGVRDIFMPDDYSSVGIAEYLSSQSLEDRRVLLARSSEANDTLAKKLASKGAKAETVHVYSSSVPENQSTVQSLLVELERKTVGGILFTSSQSASNLFKMAEKEASHDEIVRLLGGCLVGAIGPVTAERLRELGVEPNIQPARYLINEAVKLIVNAWEARHAPQIADAVA